MRRTITTVMLLAFLSAATGVPGALGYTADSTVPQAGGCPQPNRWNPSLALPLSLRWSTSLSTIGVTILTAAGQGTPDQITEIGQAISDSFGAWGWGFRHDI
jgi:hypothetical protein